MVRRKKKRGASTFQMKVSANKATRSKPASRISPNWPSKGSRIISRRRLDWGQVDHNLAGFRSSRQALLCHILSNSCKAYRVNPMTADQPNNKI